MTARTLDTTDPALRPALLELSAVSRVLLLAEAPDSARRAMLALKADAADALVALLDGKDVPDAVVEDLRARQAQLA